MQRWGVPDGLGPDTSQRVLRSFLLVRMVRGSLILVFLALAVVGVEVRDWPSGVAIAIVIAMLVQAGALVVTWRRFTTDGHTSRRA
jgi:hypothetical protein